MARAICFAAEMAGSAAPDSHILGPVRHGPVKDRSKTGLFGNLPFGPLVNGHNIETDPIFGTRDRSRTSLTAISALRLLGRVDLWTEH